VFRERCINLQPLQATAILHTAPDMDITTFEPALGPSSPSPEVMLLLDDRDALFQRGASLVAVRVALQVPTGYANKWRVAARVRMKSMRWSLQQTSAFRICLGLREGFCMTAKLHIMRPSSTGQPAGHLGKQRLIFAPPAGVISPVLRRAAPVSVWTAGANSLQVHSRVAAAARATRVHELHAQSACLLCSSRPQYKNGASFATSKESRLGDKLTGLVCVRKMLMHSSRKLRGRQMR
jgi:hypothetical protein